MSARALDALWSLASTQFGLFTTAQAASHGVPRTTLDSWLRAGRIERVAPHVYRICGAPPGWHQDAMGVTLHTGGWAARDTAIALHRLDGRPRRLPIHVLTERWDRRPVQAGFVAHETRDLRGADLTVVDGIPCLSLVRALIDYAASAHPFYLAQAFDHACRRDRTVLEATRHRFFGLARRGRKGIANMRELLEKRTPGTKFDWSGFESHMNKILEASRLPEPVKNLKIVDGDFTAWIDKAWPDIKFGVECDSLQDHFGEHAHQWERTRRRRLKRLGWELVEYTYDDVVKHPDATRREIVDLDRQREANWRS
jgi:hypothetical protein